MVPEHERHFFGRLEVLGATVSQSFVLCNQLSGLDAKEGIVSFHVIARDKVRVIGGNNFDVQFAGNSHEFDIDDPILLGSVILDFKIVVVAK